MNAAENIVQRLDQPASPVLTLADLIGAYKTDPDSTYHKLRYHVRVRHDQMHRRIIDLHGAVPLEDIKGRSVKAWHKEWTGDGQKLAIGHSFAGQLRTLVNFGATMLELSECVRLAGVLHGMRFPSPPPSTERLTAEQANQIRTKAHAVGYPSIALAQAFQFECMLRQKDVIGERVPLTEPGEGIDLGNGWKWMRGLRWSEIDANFILRHVTSKRQKLIEFNLLASPMVIEELHLMAQRDPSRRTGPVIVCEYSGLPWIAGEFRRKWRMIANACGIPRSVKSMHSRAGAISEATEAGADLEHVRHAATHSNIAMTARYSRGAAEKIALVQAKRLEHRTKHNSTSSP